MPVQKPRARTDDLVIEEVDDELLVYDSTNKRGHCLGATAARVWRACDGYSDVSALSEALELDAEVVSQALDELEALELLDTQGLKVVQAGSGNGDSNGTGSPADSWPGGRRRSAPGSPRPRWSTRSTSARPWPWRRRFRSSARSSRPRAAVPAQACGIIDGCCCCCQGGGDCKTCGATAFCNATPPTQPCNPLQGGGFGTNCSTVGRVPRGRARLLRRHRLDACADAASGRFAGCCNRRTPV